MASQLGIVVNIFICNLHALWIPTIDSGVQGTSNLFIMSLKRIRIHSSCLAENWSSSVWENIWIAWFFAENSRCCHRSAGHRLKIWPGTSGRNNTCDSLPDWRLVAKLVALLMVDTLNLRVFKVSHKPLISFEFCVARSYSWIFNVLLWGQVVEVKAVLRKL